MKNRNYDLLIWSVVAALGAFALGVILIPLREVTSASNLAFLFLAFTIIMAELGGRGAALVAALISGISLNFFLTQPYLTLTITKREDMIAFVALVVCGLIAAAFGRKRREWSERAGHATERMNILKRLLNDLQKGTPLQEILGDLQKSFGLGAIVLRDGKDHVLAIAPAGSSAATPKTELNPLTLAPSGLTSERLGAKGFRLPEGGGRLSFKTDRASISIDLWEGDPQGLDHDMRRALSIAAWILVLELSSREERLKIR